MRSKPCSASSICSRSRSTSAGNRRRGVKVTRRNFGRDRRYPITNRFRDRLSKAYEPDKTLAPEGAKSLGEAYDG
jgi:NH(3)-dependent NAD(+) synthetase (EC 6.3.1.5)